MTAYFAICDADGGIRGAGYCPEEALPFQAAVNPGGIIVEIDSAMHDAILADIIGFRLDGDDIVPRDTMAPSVSATSILADGIDACTIASYPAGCTVRISGAASYGPALLTDPTLVLTLSTPGSLTVDLEASPVYRPWQVVINAA